MQSGLERALPCSSPRAGCGIFLAALVVSVIVMVRLGRGRRFLVPAGWPGKLTSAAFLPVAGVSILALCVLLGPMAPMMSQVRGIRGAVGRPAGELEFRTVANDAPGRLSELRGKVVLVNLWATWCPPCRHEMPAIDRLQRDYADRGLVVVTLSSEERQTLIRFAEQHPTSTLNVYASQLGWLDVPGRPLTMLIDRDGVVRDCAIGARSYDEFEGKVKKVLDQES
jgi:thiol-disulfide isomerase/thioredoxin